MKDYTSVYSDEENDTFRRMFMAGKSLAEIAKALGRSKASVVQRRKRLGLPARPAPTGSTPRLLRAEGPSPLAGTGPRPGMDMAEDRGEEGGRLYDDGSPLRRRCCWPMWGAEGRPTHVYCDEGLAAGSVYCDKHADRSRAKKRDHLDEVRRCARGIL